MSKNNLSRRFIYWPALLILAFYALQPMILAEARASNHRYQAGKRARDRKTINAEKTFAQADKLRAEWKSQSLVEAIGKYEQAREFWRAANNKRQEANALKSIGDVYSTLSQSQNALDHYNKSLTLSRDLGDRQIEIEILNSIGLLYVDMGERGKTLELCERALALSRESGNKRGEAQALNNIGLVHYVLSELYKAIDYFNEAILLWKNADDDLGQAETLTNLGYAYSDLGDIGKALSFFNAALTLWEATKNIQGQARVLTALGLQYTWSGERQKAIHTHNAAAQLFRRMGDRNGEAVTFNGKGYTYFTLGENQKALDSYNQALRLFRDSGRRFSEAITMGHIAEIYFSSGHNQEALKYYEQKLEIIRSLGDPRAEAYTLKGMGDVFSSSGDKQKALDHFYRALSLSKQANDPRGQAYTLNSIGAVHDSLNDKHEALELYNKAIALIRAVEDREGERQILHNIARAFRDLGKLSEADEQLKTLLGLIERLRLKLASHDLRSAYFASTYQSYELYIDVLMRRHRQDSSMGYDAAALEVSERGRARSLLDLLAEAQANIREGIDPDLLERERVLQQLLRDLQQLLNEKAERQTRLLSGEHSEEQAAAIKKEIAALKQEIPALKQEISARLTQYEELESQIKSTSPRYAALTQPQILNLSDIQQEMDANSLLLHYSLGSEQSYLWAVTPASMTSFELPPRAEIEAAVKTFYESMTSRNRRQKGESVARRAARLEQARAVYPAAAARLSRMLLDPVASLLGTKSLVIVADGALHFVPFAALPEPGQSASNLDDQPLVVNHEIVTEPSISAVALTRHDIAARAPLPKAIAVLADPVFDKDDMRLKANKGNAKKIAAGEGRGAGYAADLNRSLERSAVESGVTDEAAGFYRLPFSLEEAKKITGFVSKGDFKLALDFDASHSTATSRELGQYRIVHFATHGLLNSVHPELSGIVLSLIDRRGQQQNGFLRLNEVYNLKLPVELVVLSACQTALGKQIKGEGLVGLTRGFMYAGAARVMASLWKIEDKASADLMNYFYQGIFEEKLQPAAALRAAQRAMWKHPRWKEPYYWAAFTLQGEWR